MAFKQKTTAEDSKRFTIGRVGQNEFWTNLAIANENGTITNDRLLRMQDEELRKYASTPDGRHFFKEFYRRPSDKDVAEAQGGMPGEIYEGVHRAQIILEYRKELKKQEDTKKPSDPKMRENVARMLDMVREHLHDKGIVLKRYSTDQSIETIIEEEYD